MNDHPKRMILVTGATGYIGGRLVPLLLAAGHHVRCLVRDSNRLFGRSWHDSVEIVEGDVFRPDRLVAAMQGVDAAYYLVHSLGGGADFHQQDITAAANFGEAARTAGVHRIIYLGGLAEASSELSEHLRSRQQSGDSLRLAGVPVTEFRAGVIVGSGSISFEMIRYLTERVPVMICPRWVYTRTQPIGIREVLAYLSQAIEVAESTGLIIEIGGSQVITYGEMMKIYADVRGLRRWLLPVPFLTPRLSSLWVNLVTPIPAVIARPLIEGLRNENIVRDPVARRLFPGINPVSYRTSVERALVMLDASNIETTWSDALSTSQGDVTPVTLITHEGMIREHRQMRVAASAADVYAVFSGLGGRHGWFFMDWAWRIRGWMDRLIGGVGMRRGRRDPDLLRVGDALDFWRVERIEPERLLRLRAEMKVPGKAWLQFDVVSRDDCMATLSQTAFFAPKGLMGWCYWYLLYPLHALIFSGMIREISRRAEGHHSIVTDTHENPHA
ncbi:MAG: SDR family oxidoreductase [Verrucomicrobia bacterium]|nr:SDR family oxidoreductase [Verrucomicrobiota bacterium]